MRPIQALLTVTCAVAFFGACSFAQELKEMQLSEVPAAEQKPVVVLDPTEAILVVYSTIPDLSFESNLGVKDKSQPYEGVHWVHLNPGTNMVIFKAPGYLSLEQKFYIPPKEARQMKVTPKAATPAEGRGSLRLESDPPGAKIFLNNIPLPNRTPLTLGDQPAGNHSIRLELAGYVPRDTILTVTKDKTTACRLVLTRAYGGLKVTSDPSGASVYLDGDLIGTTPLERRDLAAGEGTLLIQLDGYVTNTQPVRLTTGELSAVNVYLIQQTGMAEITTSPQGAEVFLDGISLGTYQGAPLVADKLALGRHTLRATLEGYGDTTMTFAATFNQTAKLNVIFRGRPGAIFVTSTPTGASIILDSRDTGYKTPYKLTGIPAGEHELWLRLTGYADIQRRLTVAPNRTETISETLTESTMGKAFPGYTAEGRTMHEYVGAEKCKICHKGESKGKMWEIWDASKHAKAYETLVARGDGSEKKAECLICHTTGFVQPSGFAIGDPMKMYLANVGCEACHGPGANYKAMSVMKDSEKARAAGLVVPSEETCKTCHNAKSPTFKGFNFAESYGKIEHKWPSSKK